MRILHLLVLISICLLDLQVTGTEGPLRGALLLVQPSAVFAADVASTRGTEEPFERHPLVTHVQVGQDARRSLLLVPGSGVAFELAGRAPVRLAFDVSAHALAPGLPPDACPPPSLEVRIEGAQGVQTLETVPVAPGGIDSSPAVGMRHSRL